MSDTKELVGRELDAAVAERVMGWKVTHGKYSDKVHHPDRSNQYACDGERIGAENRWNPSGDDNAARLVRNKIKDLNLTATYAEILGKMLEAPREGQRNKHFVSRFSFQQATAEQQCRAALAAVEQRAGIREGE